MTLSFWRRGLAMIVSRYELASEVWFWDRLLPNNTLGGDP